MADSGVELLSSEKSNKIHGNWIQMQDIWLAFVPIVLLVHIWSILHVLEELPAWILRLTFWELLGVISYTQVFALLESIFILVPFLIISLFLPKRWLINHYVPATGIIVLVISLWTIAAHNYDQVIRTWGVREFLPWLLFVAISLIVSVVLVSRLEKIKNLLFILVKRAAVLSVIYLFIDCLSLIIILIRNL